MTVRYVIKTFLIFSVAKYPSPYGHSCRPIYLLRKAVYSSIGVDTRLCRDTDDDPLFLFPTYTRGELGVNSPAVSFMLHKPGESASYLQSLLLLYLLVFSFL